VRVGTAFNKMLAIPGATVATVSFTPEGVVVGLRPRASKLRCPVCGLTTGASYDRRLRRWRHLDLGACRLMLEAEIRRLHCSRCERVLTEEVPWARASARHTRDFDDVVAWLAQRTDKTSITKLLHVSWEAVAAIVIRVAATAIDDARLDGLYRIGVDDISSREGYRYLTVIADHNRAGAVVWAAEGRDATTLSRFFDALGPERVNKLEAVSADMGAGYAKAIADARASRGLTARICIDPFHVVKLVNEAIDACRRQAWNEARRGEGSARWVKHTRWALVKDPGALSTDQRAHDRAAATFPFGAVSSLGAEGGAARRLPPAGVRSRPPVPRSMARLGLPIEIPAFVKLARTIRAHREGILAAVELGLSNSKLEGAQLEDPPDQPPRLRTPAAAVIAMIYLCCGGITVELPHTKVRRTHFVSTAGDGSMACPPASYRL
jgi:transposase